MCVFCERLTVYVFVSSPFGYEGGVWDLNVLIPDHCLSFNFVNFQINPTAANTGRPSPMLKRLSENLSSL